MCAFFGTESVHGTCRRLRSSAPFVDKVLVKGCSFELSVFVFAAFLTTACQGLPVIAPTKGNLSTTAVSQAVVFLSKYGYLPSSDPSSENLRTEQQLREAISTMQKFGNLSPTGVVDEATLRLMRRRRCGVPDILEGQHRLRRYAIQGQKWPSTNISWSIKNGESSTDESMVWAQLRRAFGVWSEASALTFVEKRGPADILVSFLKGPHGDGYPFDGEGSVLAHAFFPGEGIGGDAHFDAEERWLPTQPDDEDDGVNLFAVAAHEIGHSLGLSHSSTPGSLMFPYYQVMGEHFALPKDDADGIRHLYGSKEPKTQPTMPTLSPKSTTLGPPPTKKTKLTTKKATLKPRKTTAKPVDSVPEVPDVCNTSIDAISVIRREIFAFKGKYFWRLDMNRTLRTGYPVTIDRFWYDLPPNITHIDALYERPTDTKIVFFSGKYFWLFSANQLERGFPKPLTDLGLPEDLERIDAAMVWGHNGKTYLFSGKEYWKFDEIEGRVELDYPRRITAWRGIPPDIDAAFQWTDGNTYFFKNTFFWKFLDAKMIVESKVPSEIGGFWFRCPSETMEHTEATVAPTVVIKAAVENSVQVYTLSYLSLIMEFACLAIIYKINS